MKLTKILTIVFLLASIGAAYYLYNSIKTDIDRTERIAEVEAKVIAKLKNIRTAELAYVLSNGKFTSSWDSLISFLDTGTIYLIERKEEIIKKPYGGDSIILHLDTLGSVAVKDSIFNNVPPFDFNRLPYVPETQDVKFDIFAGKIEKSGLNVSVIEVVDPKPFDRSRKESNEARNRLPLRFGSRTEVSTSGNWE